MLKLMSKKCPVCVCVGLCVCVCVCGLDFSGSVYVSVADTYERVTELGYIKVINFIGKLSSY